MSVAAYKFPQAFIKEIFMNSNDNVNAKIQSKLSIERTLLANRRTLLAYIKSAIGLIVSGAGLMNFIDNPIWVAIGVICVILTPVTIILGIIDFVHVSRLIKRESEFLETELEEHI